MIDKKLFQKQALIEILRDGNGVAGRLGARFHLSRQSTYRYLKELLKSGQITSEGKTHQVTYSLANQMQSSKTYPRVGLNEDQAWAEVFVPVIADLPENVRDIWRFGVTEMVNNAIDHSESEQVTVEVKRNALFTDAYVYDSGIGIFIKIQRALNLYDPRDAILELAKGKFTTDPERHSGEGIFFSSKSFDDFVIYSQRLIYSRNLESPFGVLADHGDDSNGTLVRMRLANDSPRRIKAVFDEFAAPEEFTFAKTLVPVRLAQYEGEKLVSRSQAKRLTMRFEKFRQVVLDFEGVQEIGQAFADELFRVFATAHPEIQLTTVHMVKAVQEMATRAKS